MKQSFSEADHIARSLQVDFDRMLCNVLEKYHSFPGFALLLGSLLCYTNEGQPVILLLGIITSLYLARQRGEGHILDETGFSEITGIHSNTPTIRAGAPEFFTYFKELLESPERSGTGVFDQERYATATKECLQLCLCNHRNFSRGATEFTRRDKALRRSKPSAWITRLGVHSRIWKARHRLKGLQRKSVESRITIDLLQTSFPQNSPEHEYCRSLSYRSSLDLLPFFLAKSAISLELAEVLRGCTFTTMGQKFPRRMRLAKNAISRYLSEVESAVGDP
jgi:hypothetical protein